MNLAPVRVMVGEARNVSQTLRGELDAVEVGPLAVSGMLAEQLAKQLAVGSEPGAVVFITQGLPPEDAEAVVHVIAGDPSDEDEALVRFADEQTTPVVLVQLWPQPDWGRPFVLSPFVVECRPGEGFPIADIAARILEAAVHETTLASTVPVLEEFAKRRVLRAALVRNTFLGLMPPKKNQAARPLMALVQASMLARLHTASGGASGLASTQVLASTAAVVMTAGFAFREVARAARDVLPAPLADAGVAAAGTWVLAKALEVVEARLPDD